MGLAPENTKIFISYRRDDGSLAARMIFNELRRNGYENIFYDFSAINEGDFKIKITHAVKSCTDFLLILSPMALNRCYEVDDWLAFEILLAKKYNKNIIPLWFDCFGRIVWPRTLPKTLEFLTTTHVHTIHVNEMYNESFDKLTEKIKSMRLLQEATEIFDKFINSAFSKINLPNTAIRLPLISEAVGRWGINCQHVAFNDSGAGVAINSSKDFVIEGNVPYDLHYALQVAKKTRGLEIRDVMLTDEHWCLVIKNNNKLGFRGDLPIRVKEILTNIRSRGTEEILSISMNDFDQYAIMTTQDIYCNNEKIYACVKILEREYGCHVWSVDMSNSSFIVNGTNECRPSINFNRVIGFAIQQCGYIPRRVKFNDSGLYFISSPGRKKVWKL